MLQKFKSFFTSFFSLNKSEQRAIIVLLLLIFVVFTFNLILPYLIKSEPHDFTRFKNEIDNFRRDQQLTADSLRIIQLQSSGKLNKELAEQKLNPFPFNPNQLPEEAWMQLGLSEKQIRTIKNYEAKGGRFKRKEDLKKMYSISESEYAILAPYIRIPTEFKTKTKPFESKTQKKKPSLKEIRYLATEINTADSATIVNALHLPTWISARIVNYRNLLGGFYKTTQLFEVYGFDSSHYQKIKAHLLVDTSLLIKIHINDDNFKEILRHPYISYEITKQIVNYRNQRGLFKSTQQLIELGILTESSFVKLKPYLTIEPG
jgi:DNA uptake protein ComE-like DNA-binding protein